MPPGKPMIEHTVRFEFTIQAKSKAGACKKLESLINQVKNITAKEVSVWLLKDRRILAELAACEQCKGTGLTGEQVCDRCIGEGEVITAENEELRKTVE